MRPSFLVSLRLMRPPAATPVSSGPSENKLLLAFAASLRWSCLARGDPAADATGATSAVLFLS